jgi:hypothetical protein
MNDPIMDGLIVELLALAPMELGLRPETVFTFAGIMQLVLRHPDLPPNVRETAQRFLVGARDYFADSPAVLEALQRGDDPQFDRQLRER